MLSDLEITKITEEAQRYADGILFVTQDPAFRATYRLGANTAYIAGATAEREKAKAILLDIDNECENAILGKPSGDVIVDIRVKISNYFDNYSKSINNGK